MAEERDRIEVVGGDRGAGLLLDLDDHVAMVAPEVRAGGEDEQGVELNIHACSRAPFRSFVR